MDIKVTGWVDDEYHGRTITNALITDSLDFVWEYNAYAYQENRRELRIPEADEDFPEEERHENGYTVSSFDEALLSLIEWDYIQEDK